jgi:UDP:flavonoid glycosyltransferase YjiC (YdhE family)
MQILIASIPAPGHLNPLLSIASLLVESGHEVAVQVNEDLRPAVEAVVEAELLHTTEVLRK